jgi:ATP:corrinoid adenosyltransferase
LLRALSRGKNVTLVFFDKLEGNSSEGSALRVLTEVNALAGNTAVPEALSKEGFGKLTTHYTGVNRIGTGPKGSFRLYSSPNGILPEDKEAAEALDVARVGLVDWEDFRKTVETRQDPTVLILTGRRAPDWLMEQATTISSTTQLKHHGRAIEGMDC